MNLPIIFRSYQDILSHTPQNGKPVWNGQTKVFAGSNSEYVDKDRIHEFGWYFDGFNEHIDTVWFDSGHWVHSEKPADFLREFEKFNLDVNI
jgi:pimeloyl-ACP methyl ester carboxylesterase